MRHIQKRRTPLRLGLPKERSSNCLKLEKVVLTKRRQIYAVTPDELIELEELADPLLPGDVLPLERA